MSVAAISPFNAFPGQSTAEKKLKTDILEVVFQSRFWARIKEYSPDLLKSGLRVSVRGVEDYGGVPEGEGPVSWLRGKLIQMDDDVPDFSSRR